ncbi:hypothetical protein BCY84_00227 [Trypanosoma cruzi cruzi]|nr:hypothetical protein BCY84_00227 [Trypanosoma cruzi cruzi]
MASVAMSGGEMSRGRTFTRMGRLPSLLRLSPLARHNGAEDGDDSGEGNDGGNGSRAQQTVRPKCRPRRGQRDLHDFFFFLDVGRCCCFFFFLAFPVDWDLRAATERRHRFAWGMKKKKKCCLIDGLFPFFFFFSVEGGCFSLSVSLCVAVFPACMNALVPPNSHVISLFGGCCTCLDVSSTAAR